MDGSIAEQAPASPTVGGFSFHLREDRWDWSCEVARMHGRAPGFVPTTAEVLAHKHPDDRAAAEQMFTSGVAGPWRSHHRITRTDGRIREVIVVAFPSRSGAPEDEIEGFYIDVTDTFERERQQTLTRAMADVAERRAVIEQAKGMLTLVYRIPADRAFDVLTWLSQRANIKVHTIASTLIAQMRTRPVDDLPGREEFDRLLLTIASADSDRS